MVAATPRWAFTRTDTKEPRAYCSATSFTWCEKTRDAAVLPPSPPGRNPLLPHPDSGQPGTWPRGEPVQLGALTEILPTEGETLICLFFPPHQWVQLALYRTGQDLRRRKRSSTDLDGCSVWQMPLQEKLSKAGKLSFYLWESSEKNAGVLIKKHHCKWNL